jgi:hypothetical protein
LSFLNGHIYEYLGERKEKIGVVLRQIQVRKK